MCGFFFRKDDALPSSIQSMEERGSVRVVRFKGPVDRTTVSDIERFQKKSIRQSGFQYMHVLLDFKDVTHTDTFAVADILKLVTELKQTHHELGIINIHEDFWNMIQVLKMDHWIVFYSDENEAIEKLNGMG